MDLTFRAMTSGEHRVEGPRMLRLLTGDSHPSGSLVLVSAPLDVEAVREAVDSLAKRSVLQASEAGHSVYGAPGFADFGAVPLYVRIPGQSARPVSRSAGVRPARLPALNRLC